MADKGSISARKRLASRTDRLFRDMMDEEQEDAVLCSFGYDYFEGVKYGAAYSSFISYTISARLFSDLRKALRQMDSRHPDGYDINHSIISRGFRHQSYITIGAVCCFVTGTIKFMKWYSASIRCNQFLLEEYDFEILRSTMAKDPQASRMFESYCDELVKTESTLMRDVEKRYDAKDRKAAESELPRFRDGVAVALYGSLFDAWLPTKTPDNYLGLAAGRKFY